MKLQQKKQHPFLGILTKHHLIPKQRLKQFYGKGFPMNNNIIRLWRFRHDAWHVLFRQMTLNEVIDYLTRKNTNAYGYGTSVWQVLFHTLTPTEAIALLVRAGTQIRKSKDYAEFDVKLLPGGKPYKEKKKKDKHGHSKKKRTHLKVA